MSKNEVRGQAVKYLAAYVRQRNGKWQALLKYKGPDGKDKFKSKTLDDVTGKRDAKAKAEEWRDEENRLAESHPEGDLVDLGKTVGEFMTEYVEALKESRSLERSTILGYGTSLGYIVADMKSVPVVALTSARVQRFVNSLNKQGFSPSTVRKAYMLLNQGMKQAVRDGYLKQSPCERGSVRLPKKGYTRPNALDEQGRARLLRLLDSMERTPTTIAAYIALYTGMRQGEIAGLRWRAVDLDGGTIHVCEAIAQGGEGGTYSKDPKTNQDRYIPIAKGLAGILREWHEERFNAWVPTANRQAKPKEAFGLFYVVGDLEGNHRNPHTIGKDWTTIAKLYGLTGTQGRRVTFHDLRHTFATATIAKGADIRSVSDILGHENVAMTLNVYADADPNAKRRTIDMLDDEYSDARSADVVPFVRTGTRG